MENTGKKRTTVGPLLKIWLREEIIDDARIWAYTFPPLEFAESAATEEYMFAMPYFPLRDSFMSVPHIPVEWIERVTWGTGKRAISGRMTEEVCAAVARAMRKK